MTGPVTLSEPGAQIGKRTLEQLFTEAEAFGRIHVFSNTDRPPPKRYSVSIDFNTIPGVKLEAKSGYDLTIHEAFERAIARAKEIAGQFK